MGSAAVGRFGFSPQAWGCTANLSAGAQVTRRFPHRRGGVPIIMTAIRTELDVFPTGVGVYRTCRGRRMARKCFSHRRGGVPAMGSAAVGRFGFSPQAWGCTANLSAGAQVTRRFPHRRGGVPSARPALRPRPRGFPHRRGGVPTSQHPRPPKIRFSPQAWGCTEAAFKLPEFSHVFPTGVGVYRVTSSITRKSAQFSPQAWGCTGLQGYVANKRRVFPTGVGVYRSEPHTVCRPVRFPHRRGGVPE